MLLKTDLGLDLDSQDDR